MECLEAYFQNREPQESLLVYQLNPIKAAMHLIMMLYIIETKYPMMSLRTELLRKTITD